MRDRRITLLDDFDDYKNNTEDFTFNDLLDIIKNDQNKAYFLLNSTQKIICVSKKWEKICGYTQEEMYKETFKKIQGEKTSHSTIKAFMDNLNKFKKSTMEIINYSKNKNELKLKVVSVEIENTEQFSHIFPINKPKYIGEISLI